MKMKRKYCYWNWRRKHFYWNWMIKKKKRKMILKYYLTMILIQMRMISYLKPPPHTSTTQSDQGGTSGRGQM